MTDWKRPDPDELLAHFHLESEREEGARGPLYVFLGSAPGVGKTYAMLREGHRLASQGHDVVVGFVETHGRAETADQIGNLNLVPRRAVSHRGVSVEEMDVDAVLARAPEIALVDELAHTNAPGSAARKRWEDVERLRDAGIGVLTTMNVQHLESLNDVVESITGVRVNETLPDDVLSGATEVQLIDLPVEGLIERLKTGRVYPPLQAQHALQHYFRPGNLTALRELALRETAAGVDDQLEAYMRENRIDAAWPAAGKIVVYITADGNNGKVLRSAWRLADGLHGELIALAVTPPGGLDQLSAEERRAVERGLHLAEDLGASVQTVEATNAANAIAAHVRDINASIVVISYESRQGWQRLLRSSLLDQLLLQLDGVDIHIVESDGESA